MKLTKEDAIAICQDYGLATADGWDDQKLTKKLGEVLRLFRSGEFDSVAKELLPIVEGLVDAEEFELVDKLGSEETTEEATDPDDEDDWDDDEEEDDEVPEKDEFEGAEGDPKNCPLQGGERVIVHDAEENWKGIVKEAITDCRVLVRDRKGKGWEVKIEECEVVKRKKKKDEDDDDKKIRELEEKLRVASEGRGKRKKGRKLSRIDMALKVLKEREEPGTIEQIGEEVEAEYVDQGRRSNLASSVVTVKRMVKYGVLFGVLVQRKDKVKWVS